MACKILCSGDNYAESADVTCNRKKYKPSDVLVMNPDVQSKVLKPTEMSSTAVVRVDATADSGHKVCRRIT
jgi:hypothetical protein